MSEITPKVKKTLSPAERLIELDKKIAKHKEAQKKLDAMKQGIANREKEKERKARTHRLIQNGALAEHYLNCDGMQPEQFERLFKFMLTSPEFQDFLKLALSQVIG